MSENKKSNENNELENNKVFESTFGNLLNNDELKNDNAVVHQPKEPLEEVLISEEQPPVSTPEQMEQAAQNYIPESIGDEKWEEFLSRAPLPPMSKADEKRAIHIGFSEIARIKQYMLHSFRHMDNEFNRLYAIYPLALSKDFQEKYNDVHKDMVAIIEDLENLVDGKIDSVEAVQKDFRLHQTFEERRLSILYGLIEYYNNKK
ncbi:hypothetical protein ACFX4N_24320 [Priestia sp. YIM B13551]|uniref:hypothetical protein n=1 Tax=Priestia sp. YIM B13551 TaxID=3366306 RepID=UPI00366AFACA